MLVLQRKKGERIMIGDDVEIYVTRIQGNQVSIGVRAPRSVEVVRSEIRGREVCEPLASELKQPRRLRKSVRNGR